MSFSGNSAGPCPKCGGWGHVPDGVFNFIGNTIEILSAPERTVSELRLLTQILSDAKANAESKEHVASRIEKELPALSKLAKLLPETRTDWYGFLGLLLATAQLLSQSQPPAQTSTVVNISQVIQQVVVETPRSEAAPLSSVAKKSPGRNEPCPCNSGLKYKKCCALLN
ncbi:MAG: hypothetical protein HHJ16_11095 [Polaromonas sp.]|nr:hypothetical protein [Polaromonas sp.]